MWSELEIPFELAGLGIERENRIGVEIVAHAFAAIEVGTGISDGPEESVGLGIVGACHPGVAGTVFYIFARPCFRARFARLRDSPESPGFFARGLIVSSEKSARAFVASGGARDHEIADD